MMSKTVATKQKKRPGTAGEAIMCDETRNKDEGEERGWEGLEPNGARFIGRTKLAAPTPRILPLTSPMAPTIGHHPRGTCPSIVHLAVLCNHTHKTTAHPQATAPLYSSSSLLAVSIGLDLCGNLFISMQWHRGILSALGRHYCGS